MNARRFAPVLFASLLLVTMLSSAASATTESDYKVAFHVMNASSLVGWNTWFIPSGNLATGTSKTLALVGPRFNFTHGWVELNGGGLSTPSNTVPVADIRVGAKVKRFNLFGIIQEVNPGQSDSSLYTFVQLTHSIGLSRFGWGLETENSCPRGKPCLLTAGPQLSLAVNQQLGFTLAAQRTNQESWRVWLRAVIQAKAKK